MPSNLQIIVLYGPPCAGKSVLAKKLQAEFNYSYLSTDILRINYFEELDELYNKENVHMIYNMLFERLDRNIRLGNSIVIEGMFLTDINKIRIFEYGGKIDISFIYVTANYNILIKRLNLRNQKESDNVLQHKVPLSNKDLLNFYNNSKKPSNEDLIIDTSFDDIDVSYKKIKTIIQRGYNLVFLKKSILYDINN